MTRSPVRPVGALAPLLRAPGPARSEDGPVLGTNRYLAAASTPAPPPHPGMTVLLAAPTDEVAEVWPADGPVRYGDHGAIRYACSDRFLFCSARLPGSGSYAREVGRMYRELFALLARLDYPRLVRVWNHIADINGSTGAGEEVYRDFCVGRSLALEELGMLGDMPATTVIGAAAGGIELSLIATRGVDPVNVENPRQIPAYHYPSRYGRRAPNFARATYLPRHGDAAARGSVLVSGTASIIGHETRHAGDVRAQCRTALENVELLVGAENLGRYGIDHGYRLADLRTAKVYVRHPEDLPAVREVCAEMLPADGRVAYLRADICRSDLLVEVEGVAT
ncbi:FkbO/Hyg5 family chorismatase [Actinoalloteichus spitiensis]|uniref:FkbO/Hyg5 family chorismatase n=1 Tax=Actinoalloteichus spitiensis TaxID=252394 RepID=UPI0012F63D38|nr:FkbO/Hyg5 family chorismatase [Actinoalloteichus spitiensis]